MARPTRPATSSEAARDEHRGRHGRARAHRDRAPRRAGPRSRSASSRSSSRCRRSSCARSCPPSCSACSPSARARGSSAAARAGSAGARSRPASSALGGAVASTQSGAGNLEDVVAWSALFAATLRYATPLMFGALGGIFSERSRRRSTSALEGMMLMGASSASTAPTSPARGSSASLVAMVAGGVLALVHAVFSVTLRADQIVSGTAINFLALGITGYSVRRPLRRPGHARRPLARPRRHAAAHQVHSASSATRSARRTC